MVPSLTLTLAFHITTTADDWMHLVRKLFVSGRQTFTLTTYKWLQNYIFRYSVKKVATQHKKSIFTRK